MKREGDDEAPPAGQPDKLTVGGAVLLALIAISGFMTVGLLGQMLKKDALQDPVTGVVALVVGPLIALFVALVRYAPNEDTARAVGLRQAPRVLPLGLAVVAGAAAGLPLDDVVLRMFELFPRKLPAGAELALEGNALSEVVLLVGVVLLIPVAHELLYRGFLLPRLVPRLKLWGAVGTVALLHAGELFMNPHYLPSVLGLAVLAGIAAVGGGVWAAIALHVSSQAASLVASLLGLAVPGQGSKGEIVHLGQTEAVVCGVVLLVAVVLMLTVGRRRAVA